VLYSFFISVAIITWIVVDIDNKNFANKNAKKKTKTKDDDRGKESWEKVREGILRKEADDASGINTTDPIDILSIASEKNKTKRNLKCMQKCSPWRLLRPLHLDPTKTVVPIFKKHLGTGGTGLDKK